MERATRQSSPTLRTKLGYGLGSVAVGVSTVGLSGAMLQIYLNQVIGLPALVAGTLIMVSLIVDAVIDPLIGFASDRTRTRWGRRHPFMYAAAVPAGFFFYLLWNAPNGLSPASLIVFMIAMMIAVRIAISLYAIPSDALAPELTLDYDQRTTLISFRWFFGIVGGAVMTLVLNEVLLRPSLHDPGGILSRSGYGRFGLIAGLSMLVAILTCALSTHDQIPRLPKPVRKPADAGGALRDIGLTLSNRSLIALLLGGVLGGIGGGAREGLSIYMFTHLWNLTPAQIGLVVPMGSLGALMAVFVAPVLSKRFGKKTAMIGLFSASVLTSGGPIFLRVVGLMVSNDSPWLLPILVVDAAVNAVFAYVGFILVGSMMADVVEDVAVKTGARSAGLLYATNGLLPKFTGGIGAFLAGLILTVVHFPPHAARGTVDPALMRQLSLIYLPVTVFFSVVSIAVLALYRIDRKVHEQNLELLRELAAIPEVDPFAAAAGAASISPPGAALASSPADLKR